MVSPASSSALAAAAAAAAAPTAASAPATTAGFPAPAAVLASSFPSMLGSMGVPQNLPPVSQGMEGPLSQADPRTQLYISNLPYRVRWQDLKDLFRKTGTVLRADVALTPDNRSKGHGTVLMATEEDALRAVDMFNGFTWQGRLLECRIDRSGTLLAPANALPSLHSGSSFSNNTIPAPTAIKDRDPILLYSLLQSNTAAAAAAADAASGTNASPALRGASPAFRGPSPAFGSGGPISSQPHPYANMHQGPNYPNYVGGPATPSGVVPLQPTSYAGRVLFVGNLSFHCQWQDLKDLFRAAGNILRADVALGPEGRSRGFGTILFATPEDAQNAVRIYHGYEYSGRTLKVHFDRFAHPGIPPTNGTPSTPSQYTSAFVAANQPTHPTNSHNNPGMGGGGGGGGGGSGGGPPGNAHAAHSANAAATAAAAAAAAAESIRAAALVLQSQHQYAAAAEYANAAAAYAQYAQQAQAAQLHVHKAAAVAAAAQQSAHASQRGTNFLGGPPSHINAAGPAGFSASPMPSAALPGSGLFPLGMNPFAPSPSAGALAGGTGASSGLQQSLQLQQQQAQNQQQHQHQQQSQSKSTSFSSASSMTDPFGIMRSLRDGSGSTLTDATSASTVGAGAGAGRSTAGSNTFETFGRLAEANRAKAGQRGDFADFLPPSLLAGRGASMFDLGMRSGSFAGQGSSSPFAGSGALDKDNLAALSSQYDSTNAAAAALFNRRASEAPLSWVLRQNAQQQPTSSDSGSASSGAGVAPGNLARAQLGVDQWSWD
ncbi:hypothetical protein V8E36_004358, partial [Tilletia maclaganii]